MYYAFSKRNARIDEFRDEEELDTALGHDYSDGNDWRPEDLVLDPQGRIGKIRYNGEFYEYRFTDDKVTLDQLKDIAAAALQKNGWTEEAVRARESDQRGPSSVHCRMPVPSAHEACLRCHLRVPLGVSGCVVHCVVPCTVLGFEDNQWGLTIGFNGRGQPVKGRDEEWGKARVSE